MATIGLLEIFIAVIVFICIRFYGNKNGMPLNWPIVGMLPDTLLHYRRPHERITEVLQQGGLNFTFKGPWFSNMDMLGTIDPANVNYIMNTNFSNFPKGHEFFKIFEILGDGIFNADSDLWKNQRKLAQSLITHRRFYRFLVKTSRDKVQNGIIPILDHVIEKGLELDLQDLFQRFTFDVTCILVTGYDPRCLSTDLPEVKFARAMDDAEEAIFARHLRPEIFLKVQRWLGVGEEQKYKESWETLDHVVGEYVSRKRAELDGKTTRIEDPEEGVDLLTSYMTEENTMGLKPDDKFLRDSVINLLLAGRDTTSAGLTWFFYLLSKNPHVLEKIREELKSAIPVEEAEKWRLFSTQELTGLVYLHGALCETLRLYPPVPFQHKSPIEEDVLPSGHRVHPKMKVVFSLYAMGRMKSIWGEDCLEFKPERWISDRGRIKHEPSYKFLAFNAGPRTCLGKEVAFTQMKSVAAAMIHNYNVEVVKGHRVYPCSSIILHMRRGLKVNVSKRWA